MRVRITQAEKAAVVREIAALPVSIGRMDDNTLAFPDCLKLSRYHAEIRADGPALVLHDLQSHAGTFVDGLAIENITLAPGMSFAAGDITFTVLDDVIKNTSAVPAPAAAEAAQPGAPAAHDDLGTQVVAAAPEGNATEVVDTVVRTARPTAAPLNQPGVAAFPIPDGESSVGRAENNDLVISSSSVSRRHATFSLIDGVLTVKDLGSSNGTKVNSKAAAAGHALKHGDTLTFGSVSFRIEWPQGSAVKTAAAAPEDHGTEVIMAPPMGVPPHLKPGGAGIKWGIVAMAAAVLVALGVAGVLLLQKDGPDAAVNSPINEWAAEQYKTLSGLDTEQQSVQERATALVKVKELGGLVESINGLAQRLRSERDDCETRAGREKWTQDPKVGVVMRRYAELLNSATQLSQRVRLTLQKGKDDTTKRLSGVAQAVAGAVRTALSGAQDTVLRARTEEKPELYDQAQQSCNDARQRLSELTAELEIANESLGYVPDEERTLVRTLDSDCARMERELANEQKQLRETLRQKERDAIVAANYSNATNIVARGNPENYAEAIKLLDVCIDKLKGDASRLNDRLRCEREKGEFQRRENNLRDIARDIRGMIEDADLREVSDLHAKAADIYRDILNRYRMYSFLKDYDTASNNYNRVITKLGK